MPLLQETKKRTKTKKRFLNIVGAVFSNDIDNNLFFEKKKKQTLKTEHWFRKSNRASKQQHFRYSNFNSNTSSNLVQVPLPTGSDSSSSEEEEIVTIRRMDIEDGSNVKRKFITLWCQSQQCS